MSYHKYIKGPLLAYLTSGIFFAVVLGGYIYFAQYRQEISRVYEVMLQARNKRYIIEKEIERMKKELAHIRGYINLQDPKEAILQRIDTIERQGLEISLSGIVQKGSIYYMPLTIRLQAKNLTEAMRRVRSIISERFPLLMLDNINLSPDRQKTAVEVKIRGRLIATKWTDTS